ncbi:hypothetical protein H9659_10400 [Sporosarcina sp. Sa3CUA8]|uniref:Uncharacterized protein n=1 Tax=Sporosarcina gallistercoris TaxID=2762245 RepID=A0ABR8PKS2_9BACL|nr:hypothetical protein [Sporosarcina gallistercoris]
MTARQFFFLTRDCLGAGFNVGTSGFLLGMSGFSVETSRFRGETGGLPEQLSGLHRKSEFLHSSSLNAQRSGAHQSGLVLNEGKKNWSRPWICVGEGELPRKRAG